MISKLNDELIRKEVLVHTYGFQTPRESATDRVRVRVRVRVLSYGGFRAKWIRDWFVSDGSCKVEAAIVFGNAWMVILLS